MVSSVSILVSREEYRYSSKETSIFCNMKPFISCFKIYYKYMLLYGNSKLPNESWFKSEGFIVTGSKQAGRVSISDLISVCYIFEKNKIKNKFFN